ncbi:hypothetical protein SCHPADRAFT_911780 [Schizopora paradoxa]|uniref:Uncharacterized protein n=1 Tax=Schizopora paradoxa TaxID=27342 RepID=A0A0H2QZ11_9AGAM|nr:hypothetical protein SCHPADRAFT_911780 [Schizopora paradoxa]
MFRAVRAFQSAQLGGWTHKPSAEALPRDLREGSDTLACCICASAVSLKPVNGHLQIHAKICEYTHMRAGTYGGAHEASD